MRMCANTNDANQTYQIVSESMIFMIFAVRWLANYILGGLGDTGQRGPKKVLRVGPKVTIGMSLFGGLFEYICSKVRSGRRGVFQEPGHSVFFRFLTFSGCFSGALWIIFCTNIECSRENTTSRKPLFYLWISNVLTVAAGPGSIEGEKTHRRK